MIGDTALFLQALQGKNSCSRPPVWLMRQAGRYMASYRKLREKHDFLELCRTAELIATVTELPIKQFGFDAAIIFSDILLIAEALGFHLRFEEERGPIIEPLLSDQKHSHLGWETNYALPQLCSRGCEVSKTASHCSFDWFCGCTLYHCELFN